VSSGSDDPPQAVSKKLKVIIVRIDFIFFP